MRRILRLKFFYVIFFWQNIIDALAALSTFLVESVPDNIQAPFVKQNETTMIKVQNFATASQLKSLESHMGSVRILQTRGLPEVPAKVKVNSFQETLWSRSTDFLSQNKIF